MSQRSSEGVHALFESEEVQEVLRDSFYAAPTPAKEPKPSVRSRKPKAKPDHYEILCISMYKDDLARLDALVSSLKEQGHRKMSRSALIRFALDQVDVRKLPRSY